MKIKSGLHLNGPKKTGSVKIGLNLVQCKGAINLANEFLFLFFLQFCYDDFVIFRSLLRYQLLCVVFLGVV